MARRARAPAPPDRAPHAPPSTQPPPLYATAGAALPGPAPRRTGTGRTTQPSPAPRGRASRRAPVPGVSTVPSGKQFVRPPFFVGPRASKAVCAASSRGNRPKLFRRRRPAPRAAVVATSHGPRRPRHGTSAGGASTKNNAHPARGAPRRAPSAGPARRARRPPAAAAPPARAALRRGAGCAVLTSGARRPSKQSRQGRPKQPRPPCHPTFHPAPPPAGVLAAGRARARAPGLPVFRARRTGPPHVAGTPRAGAARGGRAAPGLCRVLVSLPPRGGKGREQGGGPTPVWGARPAARRPGAPWGTTDRTD